MIVPEPLRPRDRIRVVAPSGPFDRTLVLRGLGFLAERYQVRFERGLFAKQGYLAGPDESRLSELNAALADPETKAVVAARGGYGLSRIAHRIDLAPLRASPKWVVGFSDITALHAELARAEIASLHADNVAGLGRADHRARAEWVAALEAPFATRTFAGLTNISFTGASDAPLEGVLGGGNLTVLHSAAVAGRLRLPENCLLLLEDIGEAPYRVDRMLTTLMVGGFLETVRALLFGDFTDSPAGRYGVPLEHVLRERVAALRVPAVTGLPVGHGRRNVPIHLGRIARLDATRGTLVIL